MERPALAPPEKSGAGLARIPGVAEGLGFGFEEVVRGTGAFCSGAAS